MLVWMDGCHGFGDQLVRALARRVLVDMREDHHLVGSRQLDKLPQTLAHARDAAYERVRPSPSAQRFLMHIVAMGQRLLDARKWAIPHTLEKPHHGQLTRRR